MSNGKQSRGGPASAGRDSRTAARATVTTSSGRMRRIIIYPLVEQDAAPLRLLTTGIWFTAASAMRLRAHERFDTKTASFALTFHEETSAYRDTAILVLPRA